MAQEGTMTQGFPENHGVNRKVGASAELKLQALQKEAGGIFLPRFIKHGQGIDGKMCGNQAAIFHFFLPMAVVQECGGSRASINSLALASRRQFLSQSQL